MQSQLLLEREVHGTVQLSQIELERLLDELVGAELGRRKAAGSYEGKYSALFIDKQQSEIDRLGALCAANGISTTAQ